MYNELKKEVAQKNLLISKTGLIILTFGNLTIYNRKKRRYSDKTVRSRLR